MAKKYTREDRYEAAALFVATGNSMAVCRESGIPASTIRYWAQHDEGFELMCQEIRSEFGEKIKYKLAQIIDESADQALDRLRNGDVIRDTKTGELVRVPIRGKEAAIIGAIAFDKLRISESQPTNITRHESSKDLQSIYNEFRDLSRKAIEEERKFARGESKDIE